MTRRSIAHQLQVIRQATADASVSSKAAADFLKRAQLVSNVELTHKIKKSGIPGVSSATPRPYIEGSAKKTK